ncbi:MAG: TIGR04100 family radical SAM protein [Huintestinicola sp.]
MKSLTFVYAVHDNLYINITNRCPCRCTFCIRQQADGAYGSDSLWLEREPTCEEVLAEFDKYDMSLYKEIVFCGYGEPMERAEDVSFIGKELKKRYPEIPIRLNTNGLGDKINGRPTAHLLKGAVDIASISLNSGNRDDYMKVTRPKWDDSFEALLKFAEECKEYVPKVMFTVVDVISEREINESRDISARLGIPLRIRKYDT